MVEIFPPTTPQHCAERALECHDSLANYFRWLMEDATVLDRDVEKMLVNAAMGMGWEMAEVLATLGDLKNERRLERIGIDQTPRISAFYERSNAISGLTQSARPWRP